MYIKEDAHDGGIQSCDFSENLEPIPNVISEQKTYLLATCGNDSLVKLWRIIVQKSGHTWNFDELNVKQWRSLQGHGGNVICVRFSPIVGEVICSTATDRQARIWSVYGGQCLFVLDHDSIVTCCSFSSDCSLLSIGCLDRTLWIWKLPQQLVRKECFFHSSNFAHFKTAYFFLSLSGINIQCMQVCKTYGKFVIFVFGKFSKHTISINCCICKA